MAAGCAYGRVLVTGIRSRAAEPMILSFTVYKTIHVIGVVMLVGNVTATSIWKVFADRTGNVQIMAFAQRLVTITDWLLTVPGIVLIIAGGFGSAWAANISPFATAWLRASELLFVLAGVIWVAILVPTQIRQARSARDFAVSGIVPEAYRRDALRWLWWGIIATVMLIAAVMLMVAKP